MITGALGSAAHQRSIYQRLAQDIFILTQETASKKAVSWPLIRSSQKAFPGIAHE
jgi:hypothetical protein